MVRGLVERMTETKEKIALLITSIYWVLSMHQPWLGHSRVLCPSSLTTSPKDTAFSLPSFYKWRNRFRWFTSLDEISQLINGRAEI